MPHRDQIRDSIENALIARKADLASKPKTDRWVAASHIAMDEIGRYFQGNQIHTKEFIQVTCNETNNVLESNTVNLFIQFVDINNRCEVKKIEVDIK